MRIYKYQPLRYQPQIQDYFSFLSNSSLQIMRTFQTFSYLLVLLFIPRVSMQDCRTDDRCTDCKLLLFYTAVGNFYMFFCDKCVSHASTDLATNVCYCDSGYYEQASSQCSVCNQGCLSCQSSTTCQKCNSEGNWELKNGSCECKEGFQKKYGQEKCAEKANVLAIVLSTVGSLLCMVVGAVLCAIVRMRRGTQVHAQNHARRNSANVEIEIYEGFDGDGPNNTSNLFWNAKSYEYKPDQICSICLDCNPLFITECGHYFHDPCIYSWLGNKTTCPNCNTHIEAKDIRRWCTRCRQVLMPVVRNIVIKKVNKRKKELVQSTPIPHQLCDDCQNDDSSNSMSQELEEKSAQKKIES